MTSTTLILFITMCFISLDYALQQWSIDIAESSKIHFENWWNKCVGSGHGSLALRDDWREQLYISSKELGFTSVRFHGILDDDVGAVNGLNDYSFVNIDNIFDFLVSINMKPYVEISFMPQIFASNTSCTIMHYNGIITPPKDYSNWYSFIQQWMQHLVDRYGINQLSTWKFEVWNEPNGNFFRTTACGKSTLDLYMDLYSNTAKAIKSVNSKLQVGGPATAGLSWLNDFLNETIINNIPLDFLSSHQYPKNPSIQEYNKYGTNYYYQQISPGVNDVINSFPEYKDLEFILSEFNSGLYQHKSGYNNQDSEYASSFMLFHILKLQNLYKNVNPQNHYSLMSYWTFIDVFEEDGFWSPDFWSSDGPENVANQNNRYFGISTKRGIMKPVYHTFRLTNQMGSNVSYNTYGAYDNVINNTIAIFCLENRYKPSSKNRYTVFISNFNALGYPIQNETIEVTVNQMINKNLQNPKNAIVYRVDHDNSNAYTKWQEIGKPTYLTTQQLQTINASAQIVSESIDFEDINSTSLKFQITIPLYGIAIIDIQY